MTKIILDNSTGHKFNFKFTCYSEWGSLDGLWKFKSDSTLKEQCSTTGFLNIDRLEKDDFGQVFASILLFTPSLANGNDDLNTIDCLDGETLNVLALSFKFEKLKRSFTINSLPERRLFPRSKWSHCQKEMEFIWKLKDSSLFSVKFERKNWRSIILRITQVDDSKTRIEGNNQDKRMETFCAIASQLVNDESSGGGGSFCTVFENERKKHYFGKTTYSKDALSSWDRPPWTDIHGIKELPPTSQGLPSPLWSWDGDWFYFVKDGITDSEGWIYSHSWRSKEWRQAKSFGMIVRRRLWIRKLFPSNHPHS